MELRNPSMLGAGPVMDLFARAFEEAGDATAEEALKWAGENLEDPLVGVLVAGTAGHLDGLALIWAHVEPFAPLPWIIHFYAGAEGVRVPLGRAAVAWLGERGYDRARAVNQTRASDAVYARLFRPVAKVTRLGTLVEFDARDVTWD